jgi:HEAT repeat protein
VIVERPVAVVQPVPVLPPVYQPPPPPPAQAPPPAITPAALDDRQGDVQRLLQRLAERDERVRAEAALHLGRMRAAQAIDPLAATLAGDASPAAREAAARALGLIGSPKGLPALRRAAQLDSDRDVRHSATFAIDVIQAR